MVAQWWSTFDGIWHRIGQAAQAPSLQWVALIGLSLLVACYLILTRTRLARIGVVWKCIILSLLAHAVLIVLAFGTHWILDVGVPTQGDTLVIRLMDDLSDEPIEDTLVEPPPTQPAADEPPVQADDLEPAPDLFVPRESDVLADTQPDQATLNPLENAFHAAAPELLTGPTLDASQPSQPIDANENMDDADTIEVNRQNDALIEDSSFSELVQSEAAPLVSSAARTALQAHAQANRTESVEAQPVSEKVAAAEAQAADSQPQSTAHSVAAATLQPPTMLPLHAVPVVPLRPGDHQVMPAPYRLRLPENKMQAILDHGGNEATEAAVNLALKWLSSTQDADGRWNTVRLGGGVDHRDLGNERPGCGRQADTGITGLALLAFLGAGHSHLQGQHRETVARGLEFLLQSQSADGCLGGNAQLYDRMYCHGIALLALSDALAFTGDPRLRLAVEQGVAYSVRAQSSSDGGWRYRPGDSGDMSQFGWQVLALHNAGWGGLSVPEKTRSGMHRFLSRATRGQYGGLGCYRPGEGHSASMTAEALVCRFLLEEQVNPGAIQEAQAVLLRHLPTERELNYYYWYYGTLSMHMAGGTEWRQWNDALVTSLLSRQIVIGQDAGCWPADGLWAGYGGTVYSTALAALCLESYYRLAPAGR